jgi:endonuclease G, mitochondrial
LAFNLDSYLRAISMSLYPDFRGTPNWPDRLLSWLVVLCLGSLLVGCSGLRLASSTTNPNLLLGNPSRATHNPNNSDNYLIERPQYVLSYNRQRGIANWVSWQLNADWLGNGERLPFTPDSSLPVGWYVAIPENYTGTGFDRGHLVPAADRNQTPADSKAVFLLTNIFPQAPDNNRGPWEKLERYCRELVKSGKELYILAGPAGTGGVGSKGSRTSIAKGKITVPEKTWKVVIVNDAPSMGLAGINANTRLIAVVMPNEQGIKEQPWQPFRTSVREIETLTGYDLLTNLSPELQTALETQIDSQ